MYAIAASVEVPAAISVSIPAYQNAYTRSSCSVVDCGATCLSASVRTTGAAFVALTEAERQVVLQSSGRTEYKNTGL